MNGAGAAGISCAKMYKKLGATNILMCDSKGVINHIRDDLNEYKKEFLGKIPINIDLRVAADNGKPLFEEKPDHKISKIFSQIAKRVKGSFL